MEQVGCVCGEVYCKVGFQFFNYLSNYHLDYSRNGKTCFKFRIANRKSNGDTAQ